MTFGAIVLGYFTSSLPEEYLKPLDIRIIETVAKSLVGKWCLKCWQGFIRVSRKCLFLKPPKEDDYLSRSQRQHAQRNFILTLSDQQLVTGVAILVAGFANWCTMTVYEMNMVVALAWFSATTHLATLNVLRAYFCQNPVVRNWRMLGMVSIVLLLIAGLLITRFYANRFLSVPLPCLKPLDGAFAYDCNGTSYYSFNATEGIGLNFSKGDTNYTECYLCYGEYALGSAGVFSTLGPIFAVMYLLYGYFSAWVGTTTAFADSEAKMSHILLHALLRVNSHGKAHISMEHVRNVYKQMDAKGGHNTSVALSRFRKLFRRNPRSAERLKDLFVSALKYHGTFLFSIGNLLFALSYGISQVVATRWTYGGPKLKDEGTRVDFGQVVTLVLLFLPLLAAAEIFHGTVSFF
jgi:hypothetical protein